MSIHVYHFYNESLNRDKYGGLVFSSRLATVNDSCSMYFMGV